MLCDRSSFKTAKSEIVDKFNYMLAVTCDVKRKLLLCGTGTPTGPLSITPYDI